MYRIAVCDDNTLHMASLVDMIKKTDCGSVISLDSFLSWQELLKSSAKKAYDIVLLDIMGNDGPEGIQAAQKINILTPNTQIIFVTAYLELATEVYSAQHFYFLLKSQLKDRLPLVLKKACDAVEDNTKYLTVKYKYDTYCVAFNQIMYFERTLHLTQLHCAEQIDYKMSEPLTKLEQRLPYRKFIRCHNSFIVNKDYISTLRRTEIILHDNTTIPVSKKYHPTIQNFYKNEGG